MAEVTDEQVERVCYNCCLPWTQSQLTRLAQGYKSGKSVRVVAALAGVSYTAACRALKLLNIQLRPGNKDKTPKRVRNRRNTA